MKHVIIGTAGHVDHGKTTLIRALTGINTDRLKEEQERGLTIDLGFAYFDLPSGRRAGIVDVPGHEKFIKNMMAGVAGMDLVLLVIAADEGVMPQTREHLDILTLLQVEKGLVVLTKIDAVDEEWRELVRDDVQDQLQGTILEDAPLVEVSAVTGQGLDRLVEMIDLLTAEISGKDVERPFRLPVDRVFSVKGFGTVVTGTLLEGRITVNNDAEIQPAGRRTRIRNIQVHGKGTETAYAGQRVAVNLADLAVDDCARGDVVAQVGLLKPSMMLDVSLQLLPHAQRMIRHWDRIRLHIGTSEVLGRVVLLDRDELYPGEKALVQLRLEQPVAVLKDDPFVVRFYSPMETVGGGVVIDANPSKKKRFRPEVLEELRLRIEGSPADIMSQVLEREAAQFLTKQQLIAESGLRHEEAESAIQELIESDDVASISLDGGEYVVLTSYFEQLAAQVEEFLAAYHNRFPLRSGARKEEVRMRFAASASPRLFNQLLLLLQGEGHLEVENELVKLPHHVVTFTGKWSEMKDQIMSILQDSRFTPPSPPQLAAEIAADPSDIEELLMALVQSGEAIRISEDIYLLSELYQEAKQKAKDHFSRYPTLSLAEFRDLLGASRKYALPLLEHFDDIKLTLRKGDVRILHPSLRQ